LNYVSRPAEGARTPLCNVALWILVSLSLLHWLSSGQVPGAGPGNKHSVWVDPNLLLTAKVCHHWNSSSPAFSGSTSCTCGWTSSRASAQTSWLTADIATQVQLHTCSQSQTDPGPSPCDDTSPDPQCPLVNCSLVTMHWLTVGKRHCLHTSRLSSFGIHHWCHILFLIL
jgi:hypothetical protein